MIHNWSFEKQRKSNMKKRYNHWNVIIYIHIPTYMFSTDKLNGTLAWAGEKKLAKQTRELRKSAQRDKKQEKVHHQVECNSALALPVITTHCNHFGSVASHLLPLTLEIVDSRAPRLSRFPHCFFIFRPLFLLPIPGSRSPYVSSKWSFHLNKTRSEKIGSQL